MSRAILVAGALALSSLPAVAGGFGCVGGCYTPTYVPPSYGTVTERVVVRAPETYAITTPARYKTVLDTVQVGGGRYWSVTRDPVTGRKVGCWITKPATYATVPRTVMVSAPEVIPYATPAVYGYRSQTYLASPGHKAWAPIAGPASYSGYGGYEGGYAAGLGSYGYGFGARRGFGTPAYYPRHGGYGSGRTIAGRHHHHHGGRHR